MNALNLHVLTLLEMCSPRLFESKDRTHLIVAVHDYCERLFVVVMIAHKMNIFTTHTLTVSSIV